VIGTDTTTQADAFVDFVQYYGKVSRARWIYRVVESSVRRFFM